MEIRHAAKRTQSTFRLSKLLAFLMAIHKNKNGLILFVASCVPCLYSLYSLYIMVYTNNIHTKKSLYKLLSAIFTCVSCEKFNIFRWASFVTWFFSLFLSTVPEYLDTMPDDTYLRDRGVCTNDPGQISSRFGEKCSSLLWNALSKETIYD